MPDETASVGKSGLDCEAAAAFDVIAVGALIKKTFDEAGAGFKTRRGFKQRRDVDDIVNAKQFGEEHRDQDCRRAFALGNEIADRRLAVDVLANLRHERELANRSRGFEL